MQGKPRLILETQQFETCTRSGDEFPILVPIEVREWCGFPERPAVQEAKSIAQVVGAQVRIIVVGQSHQGQLVGVAAVMHTGDQKPKKSCRTSYKYHDPRLTKSELLVIK